MCTILILRHIHPEWPLVLAGNRDERYDRPTAGTQVLSLTPRIVGGRDLERQGTWMGVTDDGFFVGLTNQRVSAVLARSPRSRGEVVMQALLEGSVEAVERYLAGLDPRDFLPFNLLYGTAETLRVAYVRPTEERVRLEPVPPGIHVLSNEVLDSTALPKIGRARAMAEQAAQRPWPQSVQALQSVLANHDIPEHAPYLLPEEMRRPEVVARARNLQALCIHSPGYGTRSSAILALAPGRVAHYLATDGAPCQTPYQDLMPLLYPVRQSSVA